MSQSHARRGSAQAEDPATRRDSGQMLRNFWWYVSLNRLLTILLLNLRAGLQEMASFTGMLDLPLHFSHTESNMTCNVSCPRFLWTSRIGRLCCP